MDFATVLQLCVAVAMLFLLVAALWPKLSCELSENEEKSRKGRPAGAKPSPTQDWHRHYQGIVRRSYSRLFYRWMNSENPAKEDEGGNDKAA